MYTPSMEPRPICWLGVLYSLSQSRYFDAVIPPKKLLMLRGPASGTVAPYDQLPHTTTSTLTWLITRPPWYVRFGADAACRGVGCWA